MLLRRAHKPKSPNVVVRLYINHWDFLQQQLPIWCRWLAYLPLTQDTRVRVPVSELLFCYFSNFWTSLDKLVLRHLRRLQTIHFYHDVTFASACVSRQSFLVPYIYASDEQNQDVSFKCVDLTVARKWRSKRDIPKIRCRIKWFSLDVVVFISNCQESVDNVRVQCFLSVT